MFPKQQDQPPPDLLKIALTAIACYAIKSAMAPPKPVFHFNNNVRFSDATKAAMFPQLLQHMRNMTAIRTRPW